MGREAAIIFRGAISLVAVYALFWLFAGINHPEPGFPCIYCGCDGGCSFFCPCTVPPYGCLTCEHNIVWDLPH